MLIIVIHVFEPLVTALLAAAEPLVTALLAAAEPLVTAYLLTAEPLSTELFTPVSSDSVAEFRADIESAVAPPVILIEPCMFRLLPSHVRNPSDAPPFKLSFVSPLSYPKYIPFTAAYCVIPPSAIYGS